MASSMKAKPKKRATKLTPPPEMQGPPDNSGMAATGNNAAVGAGVGAVAGGIAGGAASLIPALTPFTPWLVGGGMAAGAALGGAIGGMGSTEAEAQYAADQAAADRAWAMMQYNDAKERDVLEYEESKSRDAIARAYDLTPRLESMNRIQNYRRQ